MVDFFVHFELILKLYLNISFGAKEVVGLGMIANITRLVLRLIIFYATDKLHLYPKQGGIILKMLS